MKIKVKKDLVFKGKHLKGKTIEIEVDINKTPLEKFWRDRLRDSKLDQCVEVIESKEKIKSEKNKNNNKKEE